MENEEVEGIAGLEDFRSNLEDLEDYLEKSKERQRKLRWWSHGGTIVYIVVFAIFITLFWKMFARNLSAENFNKSLQTHMTQIAPVVINSSQEVMARVFPVYVDAAKKKVETLGPEFQLSLEKQADIFVSDMAKFAQNEFKTRLTNIVNQQAVEFRKAYPDLTDQQIEQFINETEDDLNTIFIELSEDLVTRSLPHITEMKHLAETISDGHRQIDTIDLYRLFFHKLLLLLDYEIMEGGRS